MASKRTGFGMAIRVTWHGLLFQYAEHPEEWHVYCLENGAGGWGSNPKEAVHEMALTLVGQLRDTLSTKVDYFFPCGDPDAEWLEAYKTGKHPDSDVVIKSRFTFHFAMEKEKGPIQIEIDSPLASELSGASQFQHA